MVHDRPEEGRCARYLYNVKTEQDFEVATAASVPKIKRLGAGGRNSWRSLDPAHESVRDVLALVEFWIGPGMQRCRGRRWSSCYPVQFGGICKGAWSLSDYGARR